MHFLRFTFNSILLHVSARITITHTVLSNEILIVPFSTLEFRILLGAAVFLSDVPHTTSLIVVGILISAVARTLIPNWLDRFNRRFSSWANRLGERTPLLGH